MSHTNKENWYVSWNALIFYYNYYNYEWKEIEWTESVVYKVVDKLKTMHYERNSFALSIIKPDNGLIVCHLTQIHCLL